MKLSKKICDVSRVLMSVIVNEGKSYNRTFLEHERLVEYGVCEVGREMVMNEIENLHYFF